jgi:hypothetical protein
MTETLSARHHDRFGSIALAHAKSGHSQYGVRGRVYMVLTSPRVAHINSRAFSIAITAQSVRANVVAASSKHATGVSYRLSDWRLDWGQRAFKIRQAGFDLA